MKLVKVGLLNQTVDITIRHWNSYSSQIRDKMQIELIKQFVKDLETIKKHLQEQSEE
jgi:hypothetical protein